MYEGKRAVVARLLLERGLIKDKSQSPEGKGFKLKLHKTNPDAPLSPFYIDLRELRGQPDTIVDIAEAYVELIREDAICFNRLMDIPHSVSPVAALVMVQLGVPMITPRKDEKGYGTGGSIVGPFNEGDVVLLLDDMITNAGSKTEVLPVIASNKLECRDVVVLIDREQGGAAELAAHGLMLHAAYTMPGLLDFWESEELMDPGIVQEIRDYLAAA